MLLVSLSKLYSLLPIGVLSVNSSAAVLFTSNINIVFVTAFWEIV